ncbi:MBL fold metallo-hydrolase [Pseudochryseolinea flava]|uniref:Twin-arginine translocation pathway signal n=1 Tax=Pseudochryseolinea flava TaxID=2059302 RepID=A0A364Y8J0_9BACT|nr:MBL fold metallo-hydrolase [Pseudochryseolinea flava]RAW03260.1 twin-arginine translocation pathway signal [Pseudochryseolinea flava]
MIYILLAPVVFALMVIIIGAIISAPVYRGPVSDHFDGKKFNNPGNIQPRGLKGVIQWMRHRERGLWIKTSDAKQHKPAEKFTSGTRVTFINHSSFLIQTSGVNILTDPVFSERVSPFSFAGPKRMRPTGIAFADLPKIDLVLLSHNHYDHLDKSTVVALKKNYDPLFIVPLGVGPYLTQIGISKWQTLDWWQSTAAADISITAVPAQHFSGRGFLDRDKTLWCGYVFKSRSHTFYFAGDTGYNPVTFSEIGARIQSIDIAIIPIGAYKPQWFMSPVHCSPEEAVKIHRDVKASHSIASHFGTFPLGDEGQQDAQEDLQVALKAQHIPLHQFIKLDEGSFKDYPSV